MTSQNAGSEKRAQGVGEQGSSINVLLMTLIFPPDGVSSAQLLGEIVEDFGLHGQIDTEVITTSPHYNDDAEARIAQPIVWAWHRIYGVSKFNEVRVWHIFMPNKAKSSLMRALQWSWFHVCSFFLALFLCRKADVLMTVSPPPTITVVAAFLRAIYRTPLVYVMWEMYPQILVTLGYLKRGGMLHKVLSNLELFTYKRADKIVALHEPMRQAICKRLPAATEKTVIIPTFADVDYLKPMNRDTDLRRRHGIQEKFVVGYAGNLGPSEDLSIVLQAALQVPEIAFFICGDGSEREKLQKYVADNAIDNVIFTGHLPYEMVPEITATADVSLVVLTEGVGDEALPSKVYKVMACGRPVLAVSGPESPLANLVTSLSVGRAVIDYSPATLAGVIEEMRAEPNGLMGMGAKARNAAVEQFSRQSVTRDYRDLISSVVNAA